MNNRSTVPSRIPARALGALAVTGALALGLTACGGDDTAATPAASSSVSQAAHNRADVAFASQMVPHHQQALTMTDLARGRQLDPPVQQLVDAIEQAQAPEIQTMSGWLAAWGQPVPSGDPSSSMGGMDMSGGSMPGMMTGAEMQQLADASDADFQQLWLEMMVRHHEGAVAMARTEIAQGEYPDAIALARSIVDSQSAEIATMKKLLAG